MRGRPRDLLHAHVDVGMLLLELAHELLHVLALRAQRPEAERDPLLARLRPAARRERARDEHRPGRAPAQHQCAPRGCGAEASQPPVKPAR